MDSRLHFGPRPDHAHTPPPRAVTFSEQLRDFDLMIQRGQGVMRPVPAPGKMNGRKYRQPASPSANTGSIDVCRIVDQAIRNSQPFNHAPPRSIRTLIDDYAPRDNRPKGLYCKVIHHKSACAQCRDLLVPYTPYGRRKAKRQEAPATPELAPPVIKETELSPAPPAQLSTDLIPPALPLNQDEVLEENQLLPSYSGFLDTHTDLPPASFFFEWDLFPDAL